jgi:hypothetical protein
MNTALRPMSTGEVLDRTFNLYRNHFLLFSGIAISQVVCVLIGILVLIPLGAILPLSLLNSTDPITVIETFGPYSMVFFIFFMTGYALALGSTILAVSKVHLGQTATIRDSFKELRPMGLRVLRILMSISFRCVLVGVLTYLLVFLMAVLLVRSIEVPSLLIRWMITIFFLGVFIGGMVWAARIFCRYSLAVPACLLERLPARQAMKRSKWLSKSALGRIFLVFLLMWILAAGLSYVLQAPILLLPLEEGSAALIMYQLIAVFLAMMVSAPIGTISVCLLYYDLRVRKEAFDLQLMMEAVSRLSQPPAGAEPVG